MATSFRSVGKTISQLRSAKASVPAFSKQATQTQASPSTRSFVAPSVSVARGVSAKRSVSMNANGDGLTINLKGE